VLAFLAVALALLALLATLPPTGFLSVDSGPKYWQCVAFAEGEGWPRGFDYPARDLDPERHHIPPFTAPIGDQLASIYPVRFPLLATIPEVAAGDRALRLLPWLAALVAAWATGRLASALRGDPVTGWTAAGALAATPLAFYAIAFWEHSLASAIVVVGLLLVVEGERGTCMPWRWGKFCWSVSARGCAPVAFSPPVLLVARWQGAAARSCSRGRGARRRRRGRGPGDDDRRASVARRTTPGPHSGLTTSSPPGWLSGSSPHRTGRGLAAAVWLVAWRYAQASGSAAVPVSVGHRRGGGGGRGRHRRPRGPLAVRRRRRAFPVSAPAATSVVLSALPAEPARAALHDRVGAVAAVAAGRSPLFVARPVSAFSGVAARRPGCCWPHGVAAVAASGGKATVWQSLAVATAVGYRRSVWCCSPRRDNASGITPAARVQRGQADRHRFLHAAAALRRGWWQHRSSTPAAPV
jgi:hypothetical protein